MDMDKHSISAEKGAYISIAAYIFLSALKLSFGYFGDSKGLWADGLNNTTDIIASISAHTVLSWRCSTQYSHNRPFS